MQSSLFSEGVNIYPTKLDDLQRHIAHAERKKFKLKGHGENGFFIQCTLTLSNNVAKYILVNQRKGVRYIKCPDNAHQFMYDIMGVDEFDMDTCDWDIDSAFDPHKVSQECRERKRRRETILNHLDLYLDKFRQAFIDHSVEEQAVMLTSCAKPYGWTDNQRAIPIKEILSCNGNDAFNAMNSPAWIFYAAVVLTTQKEHYPLSELEMSVFTHLWFYVYGPFESSDAYFQSLPKNLYLSAVERGVDPEWIHCVVNDEIIYQKAKR